MITIIPVPSMGTIAYFSFKDPFDKIVKNMFNQDTHEIKLKVVSISSMRVPILNYHRDPATAVYVKAGLSEVEYKQDLTDDVPLVTFAFVDDLGSERLVEIPHRYISTMSTPSEVPYLNRALILNLGMLPENVDLSFLYSDVVDYIAERVGVTPEINDVSTGEVLFVKHEEHEQREKIRSNTTKVKHTLTYLYKELTLDHDQLLNKLDSMGIKLEEVKK